MWANNPTTLSASYERPGALMTVTASKAALSHSLPDCRHPMAALSRGFADIAQPFCRDMVPISPMIQPVHRVTRASPLSTAGHRMTWALLDGMSHLAGSTCSRRSSFNTSWTSNVRPRATPAPSSAAAKDMLIVSKRRPSGIVRSSPSLSHQEAHDHSAPSCLPGGPLCRSGKPASVATSLRLRPPPVAGEAQRQAGRSPRTECAASMSKALKPWATKGYGHRHRQRGPALRC